MVSTGPPPPPLFLQLDASSSSCEDAFLAAKLPTDQFVEQYLAQRTEYHRLDTMRQAMGVLGASASMQRRA